jgi:hypothetical protein
VNDRASRPAADPPFCNLSLEEGLRRLIWLLRTRWLIGNRTGGCAAVDRLGEAEGRLPKREPWADLL